VGDSITQGVGIEDWARNGYPAQLGRLLGEGWDVRNFGRAAATLLAKGDLPYHRTPQ
jgi:sialate O-acetylesterase